MFCVLSGIVISIIGGTAVLAGQLPKYYQKFTGLKINLCFGVKAEVLLLFLFVRDFIRMQY